MGELNFATKREFIESLLEKTQIQILVDSRKPGVALPEELRGEYRVALNLSKGFQGPMELLDDKLAVTLTFSLRRFECILPWESVWGIRTYIDERMYTFPSDMPVEVLLEVAKIQQDERAQQEKRDKLELVWSNPDEPEPSEPRRDHLHLVKDNPEDTE